MEAPLAPPMPPDPTPPTSPASLAVLTDEELMQRVQADDAPAYKALFQRHQGRVYGYLVRRTRDRQVAADLYQETFLKVYRARGTWQEGRPFKPWLFRIASNAARDHARRQVRRPDEVEWEDWRAGTVDQPDARIHLEDAVAGLPDTLRDAFLLGVVEGFDHNEVAEQLDISPANARARISRARRWLRDHLGGRT